MVYEFGEELIIESYKVPWLIWIQLLVMILIVVLLFCGFTIFSLDAPNQSNAAASSSTQSYVNNNSALNINGSSHNSTVDANQNIKRNAGTSSSGEIIEEQIQGREGLSSKDVSGFRPFLRPQHPCHYFGLAKQAILRCLGLDSDSESSHDQKHAKDD